MDLQSSVFSIAGPKGINQDSVLAPIKTKSGILVAVADGIGGKPGGEFASSFVIEKLPELIDFHPDKSLKGIFNILRGMLMSKAAEIPEFESMGTTLTACLLNDNNAIVAHVGDTRIYHLRNEGLLQRTVDQSEVQKLIDDGVLSKSRAKKYSRRNVLLSAMSVKADMNVAISDFEIKRGDRIVLSSDGFHNLIFRREIRDLSVSNLSVDDFNIALKEEAELRVPKDDCTALCLQII